MRYEPFALERWLGQSRRIDLGSAGISRLRLGEVAEDFDPDMLLSYGDTQGSEELRAGIAALYGVHSSDVLVTTGAAEANFLALFRLLDPGDEVVVLHPTYLQQEGIAQALGARVRVCELREEDRYAIDADCLSQVVSERTKVVCLVNPQNPNGQVIGRAEMQRICERADRVGAWVLCDGALRGTEVSGELAPSPIGMCERAVAVGSVSKIGMVGLRIGWLVGRPSFVRDCWTLKDYTTLSHSGIGEAIAVRGLATEKLNRFFARARQRVQQNVEVADRVISQSDGLLTWVKPVAGHTGFPSFSVRLDSVDLCRQLLAEEGVLLSPGEYFGRGGHVRLRYSGEPDELEDGLARLVRFLHRKSRIMSAGAA